MSHPAPRTVDGCPGEGETRSSTAASLLACGEPVPVATAAPAAAPAAVMASQANTTTATTTAAATTIADSSSQSIILQSVSNSQESHVTASSVHAITPPESDHSSVTDAGAGAAAGHADHLLHLSTIAAAQDRIALGAGAGGSRKRMADGEVKAPRGSMSPIKGHSRNLSTVSVSSTGSTIGELSAELRTRLSYAMVKVSNGWQTRSLEEVESLASHAASPTSSSSTLHQRHGSSASPRTAMATASAQVHFAQESTVCRHKSDSPPNLLSNKPTLAPPAPIQPSSSMPAPRSNPRRNSNPRYTPTMLSHSHSASPHTPGHPVRLDAHHSLSQGARIADPILFPSHQNVREQDAIESLLFMSSPNNSANLKHSFSPSGSPPPQHGAMGTTGRHALPSGPRKGLPTHRPSLVHKKAGFDKSPGMPHPSDSPMDLDSPQHPYYSPNRGTPKRRVKGTSNHLRGALSLPTGLGAGHSGARRVLRDEDIERMLDRAGAEAADSSDDEEIQIPRGRNGVAGVMGMRG